MGGLQTNAALAHIARISLLPMGARPTIFTTNDIKLDWKNTIQANITPVINCFGMGFGLGHVEHDYARINLIVFVWWLFWICIVGIDYPCVNWLNPHR